MAVEHGKRVVDTASFSLRLGNLDSMRLLGPIKAEDLFISKVGKPWRE
jgi:hypothetical protein